jgi:sulfur carrier protein
VTITVNGRLRDLDGPVTVGSLVDGEVADRRGVAVAIDGEVVPRLRWDDTPVDDGAHVDIVAAVQGG